MRITFALPLRYKRITVELQTINFMKAKKSSPKSIRFNIKDFEVGMLKGSFESAQDMVDVLLKNYVQEGDSVANRKQPVTNNKKSVTDAPVQKELSKAEMFKLLREGKM
jgi:hypothetical protein